MSDVSKIEQLVYFNYLSKYTDFNLDTPMSSLDNFIREAVEVIKDYLFTICLNLEEKRRIKRIKTLVNDYSKRNGRIYTKEYIRSELFNQVLCVIIAAQNNFNSRFNTDYISEIICSVINRLNKAELANDKVINFLLENYDFNSGCFDQESQANDGFTKKDRNQSLN